MSLSNKLMVEANKISNWQTEMTYKFQTKEKEIADAKNLLEKTKLELTDKQSEIQSLRNKLDTEHNYNQDLNEMIELAKVKSEKFKSKFEAYVQKMNEVKLLAEEGEIEKNTKLEKFKTYVEMFHALKNQFDVTNKALQEKNDSLLFLNKQLDSLKDYPDRYIVLQKQLEEKDCELKETNNKMNVLQEEFDSTKISLKNELMNAVETLKITKEGFEAQLNNQTTEYNNLIDEKNRLTTYINELITEHQNLFSAIKLESENLIATFKNDMEEMEIKFKNIINEKENENTTLAAEKQSLLLLVETTIANHQETIDNMKKEHTDAMQKQEMEHQQNCSVFITQLNQQSNEIDKYNTDLANLQTAFKQKIMSYQEQFENLKAKNSEFQLVIENNLTSYNNELKRVNDDNNQKMNELNELNLELKKQLTAVEQRSQLEITSLQCEMEQMRLNHVDAINQLNSNHLVEITEKDQLIKEKGILIVDTQNQLDSLTHQNNLTKMEHEKKLAEIIEDSNTFCKQYSDLLEKKTAQEADLKADNDCINKEMEKLAAENKQLKNKLLIKEKETEGMKTQLNSNFEKKLNKKEKAFIVKQEKFEAVKLKLNDEIKELERKIKDTPSMCDSEAQTDILPDITDSAQHPFCDEASLNLKDQEDISDKAKLCSQKRTAKNLRNSSIYNYSFEEDSPNLKSKTTPNCNPVLLTPIIRSAGQLVCRSQSSAQRQELLQSMKTESLNSSLGRIGSANSLQPLISPNSANSARTDLIYSGSKTPSTTSIAKINSEHYDRQKEDEMNSSASLMKPPSSYCKPKLAQRNYPLERYNINLNSDSDDCVDVSPIKFMKSSARHDVPPKAKLISKKENQDIKSKMFDPNYKVSIVRENNKLRYHVQPNLKKTSREKDILDDI